ncbi:MAG: ECF transporter S component [Bacilli bacterium]
MQLNTRYRIRAITIHSMFIALIALMGFIPFLGFLPIGAGVSITLIHIPVLLGATLLSTKSSTLFGLTFGLVSLFVVLTNPAPLPTDLFFLNPMISIFPRIIFGLLAGLILSYAKQLNPRIKWFAISIGSFLATVAHTILVLTMLWLFESAAFIDSFGNLFNLIWFILSLNGFFEAILAAFVIPVLYFSLMNSRQVRRFLNKE